MARARHLTTLAVASLTATSVACAKRPATRPTVTVVVSADQVLKAELMRGIDEARLPVTLRYADLPPRNPQPTPPLPGADRGGGLDRAREHYINAEFAACLQVVGGAGRVTALLSQRRRRAAARLLLWRTACRFATGEFETARLSARRFAVLELDEPPDADAVTPDVRALLETQRREVQGLGRAPLTVVAPTPDASVSVDGVAGRCRGLPCTVDLFPGDHLVRLLADGVKPTARRVRLPPEGGSVRFDPAVAGPELAARQWRARYAGSPSLDSDPSMRLLAAATRSGRLVFVRADGSPTVTLRGVVVQGGRVGPRAELAIPARRASRAAPQLVRSLLVDSKVIPKSSRLRPWHWALIGIGSALAVSAVAAGAAVAARSPEQRTVVSF